MGSPAGRVVIENAFERGHAAIMLLRSRVLCLHAAAKRLRIPERTLRYRASRGRVQGAFKRGKLWKFLPAEATERPDGRC